MEQSVTDNDACEFGHVLNLTAPADAAEYVVAITEQLGIIVGMLAVLAFGLTGNLAFLFVVYKLPHMRTITNFFLANLAIADILFLVVTVFMYVIFLGASPVRSDYNVAGIFSCVGVFLAPHITYFSSICCVTVISLDRFYAVCKPLQHRSINTKSRAKRLMMVSWVVAAILTAIAMPKYGRLNMSCIIWPDEEKYWDLPKMLGFCRPVVPWWVVVGEFTSVSPFLIALPCNIFMYIRIVKTLSSRSVFRTEGRCRLPPQALQVRNQVAKMLVINGIIFFLCQATNQFVTVAYMLSFINGVSISDTYDRLATVIDIGRIAVFVNSAVNPLIYTVSSPHYRAAFKQTFGFPVQPKTNDAPAPVPIKLRANPSRPGPRSSSSPPPTPPPTPSPLPPDYNYPAKPESIPDEHPTLSENGINLVRRGEFEADIGMENGGFDECQAGIDAETVINPSNDESDTIDDDIAVPEAIGPRQEADSSSEELGTSKPEETFVE